MHHHRSLVAAALFALSLAPALTLGSTAPRAETGHPLVDEAFVEQLREDIVRPVTLITLRAQNERHRTISAAEIETLDQAWRAETESDDKPTIARLMGSPLSAYLVRRKAESLGLLPEIFVMDNKGLNVGQSSVTSDYWQGDEAKWLETFAVGPDAVHYGEIEMHDGTGHRRMQVSFTITDPEFGGIIGAATVEIDLDELEERAQ
jgi:hypothetical protein